MRFIEIGSGNIAAADRVLCVAAAESAPIRRVIQDSRDRGALVDACAGKKCKAVLIMDSDHVITSSLDVEELRSRLENK